MQFFTSFTRSQVTGFFCLLIWLITDRASAQMSIGFPTARLVFQRDAAASGLVAVAGDCHAVADQVQVRTLSLDSDTALTDWQLLNSNPVNGQFAGQVRLPAGWYRLQVRGLRQGAEVTSGILGPVGVGEVLVVAGQSNGQGIFDHGAPAAADGRVSFVPHYNLSDTISLPSPPQAQAIPAEGIVGPRGLSTWCWGRLGDRLAARLGVPVLIYNVAWSGTSIRVWQESITADSVATVYNEYFRPGFPYGGLRRVLRDYVSKTGLRAVLWLQGEEEPYDTDPDAVRYAERLQAIIAQSRRDARQPALAWVISRTSMDNNLLAEGLTHYDPVIRAQNAVIANTPNVWAGPDTDVIQMPRPDGVHFSGLGLAQLGDAWNQQLTDAFFANSVPVTPSPVQLVDLRLRLSLDRREVLVGNLVALTLAVQNSSPRPATNVRLRLQLPNNLRLSSSAGFSYQRGVLLATLPQVPAAGTVFLSAVVQPQQAGQFRLGAEVVRMDQTDPDSRPNTAIADGQDDLAWADFRTRQTASVVFSSPVSVNAVKLPDVQPNGPVANASVADLSLALVANQPVIRSGQQVSVSVVVTNKGGGTAQNVQVACRIPAGFFLSSSTNMIGAGSLVRGTVASILAGGQVVFSASFLTTGTANGLFQSQIEASLLPDPNSSPNNGYTNGEDDAAQVLVRVR